MKHGFRQRLRDSDKLIGSMVSLASPAVAEVLAGIGLNWLFIDGEHGPLETAELRSILQTVGDEIGCLVRVPALGEVPITKNHDLGATGIVIPQVNTAEEAAEVVQVAGVDAVRPYLDQGYNLVVVGIDTTLLSAAATRMLGELR